ncbi:STAS domain-containing protein [Streptomyces sp. NBC_00114]|uniref:STAS domain-containing protein n=1 Tax=Streptomyces sp. NBC_00114 TaxID=2975656 RepID=UPI0038631DBB
MRVADKQEPAGHGRLTVVRTDAEGITVLSLDGEVDHQSAGALTRAMPPADATTGQRVVVDLSQVTFMDSSGINALIAAHQATQAARGWLRLAGARGAVLRTIQLVGLDTIVTCRPTVRDALAP